MANPSPPIKRNAARQYIVAQVEFEMLYSKIYDVVDSVEVVIDSSGQHTEQTLAVMRKAIRVWA